MSIIWAELRFQVSVSTGDPCGLRSEIAVAGRAPQGNQVSSCIPFRTAFPLRYAILRAARQPNYGNGMVGLRLTCRWFEERIRLGAVDRDP